jgi:hypothetical protein
VRQTKREVGACNVADASDAVTQFDAIAKAQLNGARLWMNLRDEHIARVAPPKRAL